MKKWLKIVLTVVVIVVFWAALLFGYLGNWGRIQAGVMVDKYGRTGYPQDSIVLMGSSSIQVWRTSERDLGPLPTVNVGIGGTVVKDWYPLVDDLVTPFNPKAVVIYVGANDIHKANPTPTGDLMAELMQLFDQVHAAAPDAKLYYIAVYTTGAFAELQSADDAINTAVAAYADKTPYLTYIDVATPLRDAGGQVRNDVFISDLVHLNESGYVIWSAVVRAALLADFPVTEGTK